MSSEREIEAAAQVIANSRLFAPRPKDPLVSFDDFRLLARAALEAAEQEREPLDNLVVVNRSSRAMTKKYPGEGK